MCLKYSGFADDQEKKAALPEKGRERLSRGGVWDGTEPL